MIDIMKDMRPITMNCLAVNHLQSEACGIRTYSPASYSVPVFSFSIK
jgi:hypothetical protein